MKTTLELKEFVKSLYADEAVEVKRLLPTVINSKEGNDKIINRERQKSTCPFYKSVAKKRREGRTSNEMSTQ